MATLKVEALPGDGVCLVIKVGQGQRVILRVGLDQPLIVGFDILRKAAGYDPPASWKLADETDCRILEANEGR